MPIWPRLHWHCAVRDCSRAACTPGSKSEMSSPTMAMTTNNSTNVNPRQRARVYIRASCSEGRPTPSFLDIQPPDKLLIPHSQGPRLAMFCPHEIDKFPTPVAPRQPREFIPLSCALCNKI